MVITLLHLHVNPNGDDDDGAGLARDPYGRNEKLLSFRAANFKKSMAGSMFIYMRLVDVLVI